MFRVLTPGSVDCRGDVYNVVVVVVVVVVVAALLLWWLW
jgi:hypothetical protein